MLEQNVFFKNEKRIKTTVIGCGRWGSCIAWYLDKIGHDVTLYGRASSEHMQRILRERANDYIHFSAGMTFSTDLAEAAEAELIVISIGSQALRGLCRELRCCGLQNKAFVLCMKGIENTTCKRLSEVLAEELGNPKTAVWLGPGHVEEFYKGIPNCMVIDSDDEALAHEYNVDLWPFRGALVTYSELPGYSDARYLVCNNDDTMTQEQIDELKKSMTESEKRTDVEKANLSNLFDKFIEVGGVFGMSGSVTVFGQTYEGLDVVEKLCNIQSDENTYRAVDTVLVKSVTISEYHADGESSGTAEQ